MIFETERLRVRDWSMDDVEAAFEMYGDAQVTRFIGGEPEPDLEAMAVRMQKIIDRNAGWPDGFGSFPLIGRSSGEIVGTGLLKELPNGEGEPSGDIEIGWHLVRKNWGQGYATEAGQGLIRLGFETHRLDRLHAVVDPENTPSQRVAQRLGMQHVGQTRAYYSGLLLEHFILDRA